MKKLELKAYKCTFPKLFDYDKDPFDSDECDIIYGSSQKDAVKEKCKFDENHTYWEMKQFIRTRRFKEKDLYSQEKSELLKGIEKKQIDHLTHSLGVCIGDTCPDKFYRNYSMYYEKNMGCEKLVELGLMENWQRLGSEVYGVTEKGKEAVKTLLLNIL